MSRIMQGAAVLRLSDLTSRVIVRPECKNQHGRLLVEALREIHSQGLV